MIENPDKSIEILKKIFYLASNKHVKHIHISHINCEVFDMAASMIMDIILTQFDTLRNKTNSPLLLEGIYTNSTKDFLEVSGLLKHLNLNIKNENMERGRIKTLDLINGGNSSQVANQVANYINECLNTQNYMLNEDGIRYFHYLVGEVLDNCEKHSGGTKEWYTAGYCKVTNEYAECLLSIISFGNTIYQSLENDNATKSTKGELEHAYKRLPSPNPFTKESLWTLYALQDGVSRLRDETHQDRGTGTVTFIDAFQKIGYSKNGKKPLMSITSGGVSILFDDNYIMRAEMIQGEERNIIAFNKQNSLLLLPDRKNVRMLKNRFPGTIISIKIYLDSKFFDYMMEGE